MSGSGRASVLAVASHLWGSPVHAAAVGLVDPQPGESIVDLGAGFGAASMHLARQVGADGRVIAVDPSRLMRAALRCRRRRHANRGLISVLSGSAEDLPLPGGSVDAVVAMNIVHLLADVDRAAVELTRVLRAGGRVIFVEEDLDDPAHRFHHADPHAPDGPSVSDLASALNRAGLPTTVEQKRVGGQPATILSGIGQNEGVGATLRTRRR